MLVYSYINKIWCALKIFLYETLPTHYRVQSNTQPSAIFSTFLWNGCTSRCMCDWPGASGKETCNRMSVQNLWVDVAIKDRYFHYSEPCTIRHYRMPPTINLASYPDKFLAYQCCHCHLCWRLTLKSESQCQNDLFHFQNVKLVLGDSANQTTFYVVL